jgi:hypothetical protein
VRDRGSSYYSKQFVTTTQNLFKKPKSVFQSNQGIVSETLKKRRHDEQL